MTTRISLHDQIEFAEKRVHIDKLHLKMRVQGIRESTRAVVSGPLGLGAVFAAFAVVGALGGRKLIAARREKRSRERLRTR
jgi:hypothetical protein